MAWIESHQELAQHPKTKRLAKRLGISLPAAVGHLHFLWWWALDYADDGDLSDYTEEEIAEAAGWEDNSSEFVDAMLHCGINSNFGFLEPDADGNLHIHDWQEYAGRLLDRRKAAIARTRRWREQNATVMHNVSIQNASTVPNRTVPDHTEENPDSLGADAPTLPPISLVRPSQVSQDIAEVWAYYKQHIQPKARVCPESKIRTRLKRFKVPDLKEAIDRFAANYWWMKHNAKQGGEWFFNDDSQIDRFLLLEPEGREERERRSNKGANNGTTGQNRLGRDPGQSSGQVSGHIEYGLEERTY